MAGVSDEITVGEDGESFPVMELLTGRGFVTGKSGSGKSNTASVVAEALLDEGLPLLVIDTDGEYYGLKEEYEMLHVGADDHADVQVGPDRADTLAELALDENVPIILDVSGFVEQSEGDELIDAVVTSLFVKENEYRKPFLLLVEEMHEFVPESGGFDDVGETIIRVAKRGRKRGLGVCGMSQRPAAVDKDFITQCDWIVWHRLTWENDTRVVERVLGEDAGTQVETLDPGEAIVMTDWDERTRRFRFRRKRTFDAGATPDLTDVDRPNLKSVDSDLIDRIDGGDVGDDGDDAEDTSAGAERSDGEATADDRASGDDGERDESGAEESGAEESESGDEGTDRSVAEGELRGEAPDVSDAGETRRPSASGTGSTRAASAVDPAPERDEPLWEFGQLTWFLLVRSGRGIARSAGRVGGAVSGGVRRLRERSRTAAGTDGSDAGVADDPDPLADDPDPLADDPDPLAGDPDPLADGNGRPNESVRDRSE